jgi:signal transduction histidine kinase
MTVPLAWRRRQPLAVFVLIVAAAVSVFQQAPYVGLAALMIAAYSVGSHSRHRLLSLGVIIATVTIIATVFHVGGWPPLPNASAPYVIALSMWLVGNAIRTRQLRADALEDRATRLEREREQATQAAIAEERARIARELHDVVAHNVSVMIVQAGAARHVLKTSPEQATGALRAVEASGREAMAELRHLLGLLSPDGEDVSLAPQPGVEQLESLVRRVGEAGLPVTLHIEGQPRPLPPGIDLTAYRIVQEALTNALKYAGQARTDVILDYRESGLKVEVLDDGPGNSGREGAATGHGLVGMCERVALYGGTLEAGPRLGQGYAVRAWLPLEGGCP